MVLMGGAETTAGEGQFAALLARVNRRGRRADVRRALVAERIVPLTLAYVLATQLLAVSRATNGIGPSAGAFARSSY